MKLYRHSKNRKIYKIEREGDHWAAFPIFRNGGDKSLKAVPKSTGGFRGFEEVFDALPRQEK